MGDIGWTKRSSRLVGEGKNCNDPQRWVLRQARTIQADNVSQHSLQAANRGVGGVTPGSCGEKRHITKGTKINEERDERMPGRPSGGCGHC